MKGKFFLTAIAVVMLILVSVFSCFAETDKIESKKTGIIGAMEEEVASLTETLTEKQVNTIAGMAFYEGKLEGVDAVVV